MESKCLEFRITSGARSGQVVKLDGDHITLGADKNQDLVLTGARVIPQHALIARTEEGYYLYAISDPDWTLLNGQAVAAPRPLTPGDEIRLGSEDAFVVSFSELSSAEERKPEAFIPRTASGSRPGLHILVRAPDDRIAEQTLYGNRIVVGTAAGAHVRIDDRRLSGSHLIILARDGQYYYFPEGHIPVMKDGRPLRDEERLCAGDRLQLGEHEVILSVVSRPSSRGDPIALEFEAAPEPVVSSPPSRVEDSLPPSSLPEPVVEDSLGIDMSSSLAETDSDLPDADPQSRTSSEPASQRVPDVRLYGGLLDLPSPIIELQGVDSWSAGMTWRSQRAFVTIGRHPDCDVCFSDEDGLARLQAVLAWVGQAHIVYDRNPDSPTRVNRESVAGWPRCLEHEDVLYFGESRVLTYGLVGAAPVAWKPLPDLTLEMIRGPLPGRIYAFADSVIVVGKRPGCSVPIDDPVVIDEHARIEARRHFGHDLVALASEGVLVNGTPVSDRRFLRSGDLIDIGREHELLYRPGRPNPGDIPQSELSRYALRVWGTRRPSQDVGFSEPCLLVGSSAVCDILLEPKTFPLFALLLALDRGGSTCVLPRDPKTPILLNGEHRQGPFRCRVDDEIQVGGDLHLKLVKVQAGARLSRPGPSPATRPAEVPGSLYSLRVLDGGAARLPPEPIEVCHARFTVGRGEQCDLVLKDDTVCQQQAEIVRGTHGFVLRNLGQQGTFVGGAPAQEHLLRDGDVVGFGTTIKLEFQSAGGVEPPLGFSLEFLEGELAGKTLEFARESITLGRQKGSDVTFAHPSVSRLHAEIVNRGRTHTLVPRGTTPVWINGKEVDGEVSLYEKDEVQFPGDNKCRYFPAGENKTVAVARPVAVPPQSPIATHVPMRGAAQADADVAATPFGLVSRGTWKTGAVFSFCQESVRLGRGSDCDVLIELSHVSKLQALITTDFKRLLLENRGSTRTLLNGDPPSGQVSLTDGDIVTLAPGVDLEILTGGALSAALEEEAIRETMAGAGTHPVLQLVLYALATVAAAWVILKFVLAR